MFVRVVKTWDQCLCEAKEKFASLSDSLDEDGSNTKIQEYLNMSGLLSLENPVEAIAFGIYAESRPSTNRSESDSIICD